MQIWKNYHLLTQKAVEIKEEKNILFTSFLYRLMNTHLFVHVQNKIPQLRENGDQPQLENRVSELLHTDRRLQILQRKHMYRKKKKKKNGGFEWITQVREINLSEVINVFCAALVLFRTDQAHQCCGSSV